MNETSPSAGAGRPKYRKLRIAFSSMCGIVFLLLIALWVRSYSWHDYITVAQANVRFIQLETHRGSMVFLTAEDSSAERGEWHWNVEHSEGYYA
jgi:hypothetical protein